MDSANIFLKLLIGYKSGKYNNYSKLVEIVLGKESYNMDDRIERDKKRKINLREDGFGRRLKKENISTGLVGRILF